MVGQHGQKVISVSYTHETHSERNTPSERNYKYINIVYKFPFYFGIIFDEHNIYRTEMFFSFRFVLRWMTNI